MNTLSNKKINWKHPQHDSRANPNYYWGMQSSSPHLKYKAVEFASLIRYRRPFTTDYICYIYPHDSKDTSITLQSPFPNWTELKLWCLNWRWRILWAVGLGLYGKWRRSVDDRQRLESFIITTKLTKFRAYLQYLHLLLNYTLHLVTTWRFNQGLIHCRCGSACLWHHADYFYIRT